MTDDQIERAIQFLLDNQAAHDVRLARLEEIVVELANNQKEFANNQKEMFTEMRAMQAEFREGIEKILTVAEQTMKAVQAVAEAEARTIRRVGALEDRVDEIEDKIK